MLYREIIAVFSEIHVKHINTPRKKKRRIFFNADVVVNQITTCFKQLKREACIGYDWNRI